VEPPTRAGPRVSTPFSGRVTFFHLLRFQQLNQPKLSQVNGVAAIRAGKGTVVQEFTFIWAFQRPA